jgi:hypothetical protein
LGRRQVVRQRILIPSFGGSSPPAPASVKSLICHYFSQRGLCRKRPEHVGFSARRFRWWGAETNSATPGLRCQPVISDGLCSGYRQVPGERRASATLVQERKKAGIMGPPRHSLWWVVSVGQVKPKAPCWPGQSSGIRVARSSFSAVSVRGCCPRRMFSTISGASQASRITRVA